MNETELNQFTLSIECLKLALRLSRAINNETIDLNVLREGYRIDNPNGPIIPHENELSKSDLYQDAQNLQVSALGTCILYLDKLLESFVKKNPSSEVNFDKIRSIIFQLRNAYAHNPLRPTWYCWTKYLREYNIELNNESIIIDLSTLNGQEFDINQIGAHNLFVKTGKDDLQAALRKMGTGLFVTSVMGQGINTVTGDYSRGASGYWVENGEIQFPVSELTIAGNLKDMYNNLVLVANDVDKRSKTQTGSWLIEEMTIAGD